MDVVLVIGRVLFALVFIASGVTVHLVGRAEGVEYARASGAPAPELLVPLSGVAAVAGGAMIALGLWADLGAILVAGFLVGITPYMHAFWKFDDPQMRTVQMAMFMKNASMLGGAVIVFWLYNQSQDVAGSITNALFGRL
jgi:putative oxidoreductase